MSVVSDYTRKSDRVHPEDLEFKSGKKVFKKPVLHCSLLKCIDPGIDMEKCKITQ